MILAAGLDVAQRQQDLEVPHHLGGRRGRGPIRMTSWLQRPRRQLGQGPWCQGSDRGVVPSPMPARNHERPQVPWTRAELAQGGRQVVGGRGGERRRRSSARPRCPPPPALRRQRSEQRPPAAVHKHTRARRSPVGRPQTLCQLLGDAVGPPLPQLCQCQQQHCGLPGGGCRRGRRWRRERGEQRDLGLLQQDGVWATEPGQACRQQRCASRGWPREAQTDGSQNVVEYPRPTIEPEAQQRVAARQQRTRPASGPLPPQQGVQPPAHPRQELGVDQADPERAAKQEGNLLSAQTCGQHPRTQPHRGPKEGVAHARFGNLPRPSGQAGCIQVPQRVVTPGAPRPQGIVLRPRCWNQLPAGAHGRLLPPSNMTSARRPGGALRCRSPGRKRR
mmetsp:Transcript_175072/g.556008  ORF Transcript_175072/g.556008 Transcript_175072/m.556008 type:complete len:390 (-) Transcript_175072:283-1452(-)